MIGQFRRDVPIEAWCAAGITAVRHEDCGPCTQLGVFAADFRRYVDEDVVIYAASNAEVTAIQLTDVLPAVVFGRPYAMPPDVALVWRFTRATLAHDAAADAYRDAIVARWGRRALVSIAFAITAARLYPTVKYALGHGQACTRIVVGGTPVVFDRRSAPARTDVAMKTA